MKEVIVPFQQFSEVDGSPLDLGKLYIGVDGLDAETNPQAAFWDSALTIPASQPIDTVAGRPWNTNAFGRIYTADPYSITAKDKHDVVVVQNLDYSAFYEAALVAHEADTTTHGTGSAIVGVDDIQDINNKTIYNSTLESVNLNTPIITTPTVNPGGWTNAKHTHSSASQGGYIAPLRYRSGFEIANSGADPINDVSVAPGLVTDSTGVYPLALTSTIMGQLDGNWVAGTNQGKLDVGAKADATWYHIFIIGKTDGTTDILFSTSYSAPTLPATYTLKAYSGRSFYNISGASGIAPFLERNGKIFLKTPVEDRSDTAPPLAAESTTLSVPSGLSINAIFCLNCFELTGLTTRQHGIISNTDLGDIAPSASVHDFLFHTNNSSGCGAYSEFTRPTNASAAITVRFDAAAGDSYYSITTRGWEIPSP